MTSISESLQAGLEHHRAGRLMQAEQMYRRVLQIHPRHAGAVHLLGLIAFQAGKLDIAEHLLQEAIKIDSFHAPYSADLGEVYRALGKTDEAISAYAKAIELNPETADAHNNLGTLLRSTERQDEACASFREALRLNPAHPEAAMHLGATLQSLGKLAEAEAAFAAAVKIAPEDATVYLAFGKCMRAQNNLLGAIACFQMAARLDPDFAQAYHQLGRAHQAHGEPELAASAYVQALQREPGLAETHYNLGVLERDRGRPRKALASFLEAAHCKPSMIAAHLGLANLYLGMENPDQAAAASRVAVSLNGESASAAAHLAAALQAQGDLEGAIAAFRRGVELNPGSSEAHSNLLYALNFDSRSSAAALFAEHRAWAERHAEAHTRLAPPHANNRDPNRRLRIGYVSSHFREHSVTFFSLPLLSAHDRDQFEVFGYSNSADVDAVTERFQLSTSAWRQIERMSDDAVAAQIREDEIDILVDLTGHIGGNRLTAFARKAGSCASYVFGLSEHDRHVGHGLSPDRRTCRPAGPDRCTLHRTAGAIAGKLFLLSTARSSPRGERVARADRGTRHVRLAQLPGEDHAAGDRDVGAAVAEDSPSTAGGAGLSPGRVREPCIGGHGGGRRRSGARGNCQLATAGRLFASARANRSRARFVSVQWPYHDLQCLVDGSALGCSRRFQLLVALRRIGAGELGARGVNRSIRRPIPRDRRAVGGRFTAPGRVEARVAGPGVSIPTCRCARLCPSRRKRLSPDVATLVRREFEIERKIMTTIPEAVELGLTHHRAGQLQQAESIYRQVLEADPKHAVAAHLWGVVALEVGRYDIAVERISVAVRLDGRQAAFHVNLAAAYRGLGRLVEARQCYEQALRLQPDMAEAQNNLGTMLQSQGKRSEAAALYQQAIAKNPRYADAHNNLGTVYQEQGEWPQAIACFRTAVEVEPRYPRGFYNLGAALAQQKHLDQARAAFEQAIALSSQYAEAHYGMALVLHEQNEWSRAEAAYREALRLRPDMSAAACAGNSLSGAGQDQRCRVDVSRGIASLAESRRELLQLGRGAQAAATGG